MSYLPILLNIEGKRVLVVGGGVVAYRRIKNITDYTKELKVVSKALREELRVYLDKKRICYEEREYTKGDLVGVGLCIVATSDRVKNKEIVESCKRARILYNDASVVCSEISFPSSYVVEGEIIMSYYTYGNAPIVGKKIRDDFIKRYEREYKVLLKFFKEHRVEYNELLGRDKKVSFWEAAYNFVKGLGGLGGVGGISDVSEEELTEGILRILKRYKTEG